MKKFYVDIDDTVLAKCLGDSFDLRPGVMTQLTVLSKLFDCYWVTHWSKSDVDLLCHTVNASHRLYHNFQYLDWRRVDSKNKAPAIIANGGEFYWLEDKHSTGNLDLLQKMDLMGHYIEVESTGLWGFTRALQTLFEKAEITDKKIIESGGKPSWFQEPLGLHFDWTYYK